MDCTELDEVEGRVPDDPAALSLDELRLLRNELQNAESGLSYVRRVLQGRLDIVAEHRGRGGAAGANGDVDRQTSDELVASLSATLARNTHWGGSHRPPQDLAPPPFAETLLASYDAEAPHDIGGLADLDVGQIDDLMEGLAAAETEVSQRRQGLHVAIDSLQAETIRRYRDGESSVDDLLP